MGVHPHQSRPPRDAAQISAAGTHRVVCQRSAAGSGLVHRSCAEVVYAVGSRLLYACGRNTGPDMGLRGHFRGCRNRSCADHKGTETLPEGQSCGAGTAWALHCPADIPRVEANRLLHLAGAEGPENGEQCAKGISAENRGAGTGGRKRAAAGDKGNVGWRLSGLRSCHCP